MKKERGYCHKHKFKHSERTLKRSVAALQRPTTWGIQLQQPISQKLINKTAYCKVRIWKNAKNTEYDWEKRSVLLGTDQSAKETEGEK